MAHWRTSRHRKTLQEAHDALVARIEEADQQLDQAIGAADSEIEPLAERVNEVMGQLEAEQSVTATQWLELRAAQAAHDLVEVRHSAAIAEATVMLDRLRAELAEVDVRMGQVDHAAETGAVAAGNDAQMEILMLDAREASLREGLAVATADLARRRLELVERMHHEIHAALEKQRQPTKAGRAKGSWR